MHTPTYICIYTYTNTELWQSRSCWLRRIYKYVYMYTYMYIYVYVYIHTYIYICLCI